VTGYRSSRADGIELTVGILAAALGLAECVAGIVLVNRPGIMRALGLPDEATAWVTFGAIAAMVVVGASVLMGVTPPRARA
jgi:hypothetical protein